MRNEMPVKLFPGILTKEELRKYILQKGCYAAEENERIYNKWFLTAPRYLFRAVDRKYHVTERIVCDIGCSYGMNLLYCISGSYGIEMDEYAVKFAQSIGLQVYHGDFMKEDISAFPQAEFIWCSAVLEHVDSPHLFLRRLHSLLLPDGMMVIFVPTIPLLPWLGKLPGIGKFFSGYTAADHVNAFSPATIRFTCERAGFCTREVTPFYPQPFALFNRLPLFNRLIDGCIYIGKKINNWEYAERSTRKH